MLANRDWRSLGTETVIKPHENTKMQTNMTEDLLNKWDEINDGISPEMVLGSLCRARCS